MSRSSNRSALLRSARSSAPDRQPTKVRLVAIVGGSGSGKTWLAERLRARLGSRAGRLSLDDFYRDRSHLPPARRSRLNFDHPRAIDWNELARALEALASGHAVSVPCYDFSTHTRQPRRKMIRAKGLLLVDGLWLLRRASLRRCFALSVFLECPRAVRLRRRLARDRQGRGRSRAGILRQFRTTVEPMHQRYVASQTRWADLVLAHPCSERQVRRILARLRDS